MAKASSMQELEELHRLVTRSFKERIGQDLEDNVPTDAATLGAAIKFLKDNNVSADPAEAEDLSELREKFKEMSARRRERGKNVVDLLKQEEQDVMTG